MPRESEASSTTMRKRQITRFRGRGHSGYALRASAPSIMPTVFSMP